MTHLTRFLVPVLLLFTAAMIQSVPTVEIIDTSVTCHSSNINSEVISQLPISRNAAGLLQIAPAVTYNTNVSPGSKITSTSQFVDNSELQVLVRVDGPNSSNLQVCDLLSVDAICVQKGGKGSLSIAPGAQYGGNATGGVVNFITKSGSTEFSQGRLFNPNASNFKTAKFPYYYAPEKDFPLGAISSAGVSADASASFQVINFPGNSYFFFRENNSKFRPVGQFIKIDLGNVGFVSSGALSNRIDNLNGPDYRFFGYRQYFNIGTSNLKSQVKLQILDADNWSRIGNPFNYTPKLPSRYPAEEQAQSVEIDPGAAYLAFTRYHATSDRNLGYVRIIKPTGGPGTQKLFTPVSWARNTDFGVNALDIIRVTSDVSPEP